LDKPFLIKDFLYILVLNSYHAKFQLIINQIYWCSKHSYLYNKFTGWCH